MKGVFYLDKSEYNNTLNPLKNYLEQLTTFIAKYKGYSREKSVAVAKELYTTYFKDKQVEYFERENFEDKQAKSNSLTNYIYSNIKAKNIFVPTFTSYVNSSVKKSILSEFIFENVKKRSQAKKTAHAAKVKGDMLTYESYNNVQSLMKIYNNSLSGAFAQEACILHNPTSHSTLTSITRTITSLSNASNERVLYGNRLYLTANDVLNEVTYIVTYCNAENIKNIVNKYNLHIPTVDETIELIRKSADLYFIDKGFYEFHLKSYLSKLSSSELCAICYTLDLYTLATKNELLFRTFLKELTTKVLDSRTDEEVLQEIKEIDEAILNFVHLIFYSEIKGKGKEYDKLLQEGLTASIVATAKNVQSVLLKYSDLLQCFFRTNIFPINSNKMQYMKRRAVVLSDTDSTCYTLDKWVKWYMGEFIINDTTIALAGAVAYISSQVIVHLLAMLSKYMNIEQELLNTLAMKNEYLWLAFNPMEVSKHYIAYTVVQEGNVFKEPDLEIKGVHLKNSAVPIGLIKHAKELYKYVLEQTATNNKIDIKYLINEVIQIEKSIAASVKNSEVTYLKKSKIKSEAAYALDKYKSPYSRHLFWKEVFAPKYGVWNEPPYDVVKIPTTLKSKKLTQDWIESIEDVSVRTRLIEYFLNNDKKDLPTIYLNEEYVRAFGIPDIFVSIIDIKKIILDVTIQHRLLLESLGLVIDEDLLISEIFK